MGSSNATFDHRRVHQKSLTSNPRFSREDLSRENSVLAVSFLGDVSGGKYHRSKAIVADASDREASWDTLYVFQYVFQCIQGWENVDDFGFGGWLTQPISDPEKLAAHPSACGWPNEVATELWIGPVEPTTLVAAAARLIHTCLNCGIFFTSVFLEGLGLLENVATDVLSKFLRKIALKPQNELWNCDILETIRMKAWCLWSLTIPWGQTHWGTCYCQNHLLPLILVWRACRNWWIGIHILEHHSSQFLIKPGIANQQGCGLKWL